MNSFDLNEAVFAVSFTKRFDVNPFPSFEKSCLS